MSYDLMETTESKKTLILGQMSKIKDEISSAKNELEDTKNSFSRAQSNYNSTEWYHPIQKHKYKKELDGARDRLLEANSNANIQIFKILGYTLEFVVLAVFIPLDLIQLLFRWVTGCFKKRDESFGKLAKGVSYMAQERNHKIK